MSKEYEQAVYRIEISNRYVFKLYSTILIVRKVQVKMTKQLSHHISLVVKSDKHPVEVKIRRKRNLQIKILFILRSFTLNNNETQTFF